MTIDRVIDSHSARIRDCSESDKGEVFISFRTDLAAHAMLDVMVDIAKTHPNEIERIGRYSLRLWWD